MVLCTDHDHRWGSDLHRKTLLLRQRVIGQQVPHWVKRQQMPGLHSGDYAIDKTLETSLSVCQVAIAT